MPKTPDFQAASLALSKALIALQSVTPIDAGCMDLIAKRLNNLDFNIHYLPYAEVKNLWAVKGKSGPLLAFAGHTDVVPSGPSELWQTPPFEPTVRGDYLYGRGAADMKGSIAAMIVAIEYFCKHFDFEGQIAILLTSDEEGPGIHGTKAVMHYLDQTGVKIDYCIVGEPSSEHVLGDIIKHGRRGSLHGDLRIIGKQGHVAYPQHAHNPIPTACQVIAEISAIQWDEASQDFPASQLQFTNLSSGTGATNVIPGHMDCRFNIRFAPGLEPKTIQTKIEQVLQLAKVKYELKWNLTGLPFLSQGRTLLPNLKTAIQEVTQQVAKCSTAGGTSDARFIASYGVEVLEFGPCNGSIHQINESVKVEELGQLSQIYAKVLEKTLKSVRPKP